MSSSSAKTNPFSYAETSGIVSAVYSDGKWGPLTEQSDPYLRIHAGSTALNYGQAIFEGLKAFRHKDGRIAVFRPAANAKRMADSAQRLMMPPVPTELFLEAINRVVLLNQSHVPSYESGGSLYIRPVLIGNGPQLSLKPADEYIFYVIVTPIGGGYYAADSVTAMIVEDSDRAAPLGTGAYKVAGNYAPALQANQTATEKGCAVTLYLDAKEHRYVEEFNSSNFVAITADGAYVTPQSFSILPSITNLSLCQLAADKFNLRVERRSLDLDAESPNWKEIGAVGTAVICTPVMRLLKGDRLITLPNLPANEALLPKLKAALLAIQRGDESDPYGWLHFVA